MAKFVYGLNQSLDGYVDHMKLGPPAPADRRRSSVPVRSSCLRRPALQCENVAAAVAEPGDRRRWPPCGRRSRRS